MKAGQTRLGVCIPPQESSKTCTTVNKSKICYGQAVMSVADPKLFSRFGVILI